MYHIYIACGGEEGGGGGEGGGRGGGGRQLAAPCYLLWSFSLIADLHGTEKQISVT